MADNVTLPGNSSVVATDDVGGVHYQLVKLAYGALDTATLASDTNPFPISLKGLNYPASTANSTTAQLAASATFTGTLETIQNQQAAQIEVVCDQPYTLTVFQYIDAAGTKLASTDVFTRTAGQPLNENVTLPGNYFKLSLQNTGASTTTTLQVDVTFGIMATGPRALTNSGNSKVAILEGLPAVTGSGSLTAQDQAVTLALAGKFANATFQVTGTWVGTITFEASNDGFANSTTINALRAGDNTISQTITNTASNDIYRVTTAGFTAVRARMSAYTSGTAVLTANACEQTSGVFLNFPLPAGSNVVGGVTQSGTWTVQPGNTANTTPWKVDGSSVTQPASLAVLPAAAAMADAFANPTVTTIGVGNLVFNGSTWDRQRGMSVATTTGDTGAKTATGNGATQTNVGNKGLQLVIVLGTVSGTTPTCVFKLQNSVDGGTTWVDIPGAATASLTATGNFGISVYPGQVVTAGTTTTNTTATANGIVARTWRVVWTIGGTTPSFTITSISYNYLPN